MTYTAAHALRCRADFPALTKHRDELELAFLDGPGGSQVPAAVLDAIADCYATCNVNTHGNFPPSREVDRRMQRAREVVAVFLNAPSADCISFGQNMTTLNFSLSHAIGRTLRAGDEVLITELDHEANRGPWLGLGVRAVEVLGLAERGGLLRTGISMYSTVADIRRLLAAIEKLA